MFWNKNNKEKDSKFKCSTCGKYHKELPALGFKTPFHYDILNDDEKNNLAEISDDFCIIKHGDQTDRFIRSVLTIKINDTCENLDYGIWVSISEKSYDEYKADFKKEAIKKTYFGMICNEISDYKETTIGLRVNVETRKNGIRPELIPHENEHKLITDWKNGISLSEAENRIERMIKNVG